MTANRDRAFFGVIKPKKKFGNGCLSGTAFTDHPDLFTRLD